MWRTVIINQGERINLRNNWLIVTSGSGEAHVPVEDIYALVIDNRAAAVSVGAINALAEAGAHILSCNEKHVPISITLPLNTHYRPLAVIRKQIQLSDEFKAVLWQKIIRQKILNQAAVLQLVGISRERYGVLQRFAEETLPGDTGKREGVAARYYFKTLFGPAFLRSDNDITNAALNYGYTILRSSTAKTLAAYGYNCVLGIHHINEQNSYNLADDMMEPLRPVVDLWTDKNCDNLVDKLTKTHRKELINLVNAPVKWENKTMKLRNALDRYISSLTTAIEKGDPKHIQVPKIMQLNQLWEMEDD